MVVIKIAIVQCRNFYELKICKLRVFRYLVNFRDVICVVSMHHIIKLSYNIHCNPFKIIKFKYISSYMLIYVKILKSSDCLDILYVDA